MHSHLLPLTSCNKSSSLLSPTVEVEKAFFLLNYYTVMGPNSHYQKAYLPTPSLVPHITEQQPSILIDKGQRETLHLGVCVMKATRTHMHIYKHTTCLQEAVSHVSI